MKMDIKQMIHPDDASAVAAIKAIPKMSDLMSFISKNSLERLYQLVYTASYIQITERSCPVIHNVVEEVCKDFGIKQRPLVFIQRTYDYTVQLSGIKQPMIIISSSIIEDFDDETLRLFLYPYIAGIKAEHNLMEFLRSMFEIFGGLIPVPQEAYILPLNQWSKYKDYTYDRIRLVVSNDFDFSLRSIDLGEATMDILAKTSVDSRIEDCLKMSDQGLIKKISKGVQSVYTKGAWNSLRILELFKWHESGEYESVKHRLDMGE